MEAREGVIQAEGAILAQEREVGREGKENGEGGRREAGQVWCGMVGSGDLPEKRRASMKRSEQH